MCRVITGPGQVISRKELFQAATARGTLQSPLPRRLSEDPLLQNGAVVK